jgi:hypothetical protein
MKQLCIIYDEGKTHTPISFIQIYNESIFDLIDANDESPLKMHWKMRQKFTMENMFEGQCRSTEAQQSKMSYSFLKGRASNSARLCTRRTESTPKPRERSLLIVYYDVNEIILSNHHFMSLVCNFTLTKYSTI